jgi:hypothetical protein
MAQKIPKVPAKASAYSQSTERWPNTISSVAPSDLGIELTCGSTELFEDEPQQIELYIPETPCDDVLRFFNSVPQSQAAQQERPSSGSPRQHNPFFCEVLPFLEVPVFALSKCPTARPRHYTNADGRFNWTITTTSSAGSATIMDGDPLIVLTSTMALGLKRTQQVPGAPLRLAPHQILTALGRSTGGRQYRLLRQSLERLRGTHIRTNMAPDGHPGDRTEFPLIQAIHGAPDGSLEITLPPWIVAAISAKRLLKVDPGYFRLTSGYERFLYRTARKHAYGHGPTGWSCSLPTLFQKSGSIGTPARFKFELKAAIQKNADPTFDFEWVQRGRAAPLVLMRRRQRCISATV